MSDVSLVCEQAKKAFLALAPLNHVIRNKGLLSVSKILNSQTTQILIENQKDLEVAKKMVEKGEIATSLLDRLKLNDSSLSL